MQKKRAEMQKKIIGKLLTNENEAQLKCCSVFVFLFLTTSNANINIAKITQVSLLKNVISSLSQKTQIITLAIKPPPHTSRDVVFLDYITYRCCLSTRISPIDDY